MVVVEVWNLFFGVCFGWGWGLCVLCVWPLRNLAFLRMSKACAFALISSWASFCIMVDISSKSVGGVPGEGRVSTSSSRTMHQPTKLHA